MQAVIAIVTPAFFRVRIPAGSRSRAAGLLDVATLRDADRTGVARAHRMRDQGETQPARLHQADLTRRDAPCEFSRRPCSRQLPVAVSGHEVLRARVFLRYV